MSGWFSSLNPSPAFPEFSGPYSVGTFDVETPVADLEDGSSPSPDPSVTTISFRVFYPCSRDAPPGRPVYWCQKPQQETVAAYARFVGAKASTANLISKIPHLLYHTKIPAKRNAELLSSPHSSSKWPVMIFSHGLSGTRNAYSFYCGSLASQGMIVIAPDHRDGSQPISFLRETDAAPASTKDYVRMSHTPSDEVYNGRDEQLKVRIWELGLLHEALLRLGRGDKIRNLDENLNGSAQKDASSLTRMFKGCIDVEKPGSITWAGHSFGACTTVQLLKSVYYSSEASTHITTAKQSALKSQITPESPMILLDLWTLPLNSPATAPLWERPLPCFAPGGPGGARALHILSEGFVKWKSNFRDTLRVMRDPTVTVPPAAGSDDEKSSARRHGHVFYPIKSVHLEQSDFGLLFPRLTKYLAKSEEPLRTMKLNLRASLAVLKGAGVPVADVRWEDLEDPAAEKGSADWKILDSGKEVVRGWVAVRADVEVEEAPVSDKSNGHPAAAGGEKSKIQRVLASGGKAE